MVRRDCPPQRRAHERTSHEVARVALGLREAARPAQSEDGGSVKKKKCAAKKPRTLNAVWADARCYVDYAEKRTIYLDGGQYTIKQALRLSKWLAEAAAWKAEE